MIKLVEKAKKPMGLRVVIYGQEGIGKTSLAQQIPNSVWYDLEDTVYDFGPGCQAAETKGLTEASFMGDMQSLIRDHQGFKTVIIDTADALEEMIANDICKNKNIESLASLDWGAGYNLIEEAFRRILDRATELMKSGMNVVFVAHSELVNQKLPGQRGSFDRDQLKLTKKVNPLFKQWADLMIFVYYKEQVSQDPKTKQFIAQGGLRFTSCDHTVTHDGKCRKYVKGFPNEVSLDRAFEYLPKVLSKCVVHDEDDGVSKETVRPVKKEQPDSAPKTEEELDMEAAENAEFPPPDDPIETDRDDIKQMFHLIEQYGVDIEKLKVYIKGKKRLPESQIDDVGNWPAALVGWLNRGMDKIASKLV